MDDYVWDFSNGGDVISTSTGDSLSGWTGGGGLLDVGGMADPTGSYSWFSPNTSKALDSGLGMSASDLVGKGASFLGGVGNWWNSQSAGTQGLLSSLATGAASAYLQGRQYDKQREYERRMRKEDRDEMNKLREVPTAEKVGVNGGFKWSK